MRLGNFKRLYEKDYPQEQQSLVQKLAISINSGIESIYLALSKRLTFSDNMQSTVKDFDVVVDANGKPKTTTIIKLDDNNVKVSGLVIWRCDNLTNTSSYVISCPFISWTQVQTGISIDYINGLIPTHSYRIRVVTMT